MWSIQYIIQSLLCRVRNKAKDDAMDSPSAKLDEHIFLLKELLYYWYRDIWSPLARTFFERAVNPLLKFHMYSSFYLCSTVMFCKYHFLFVSLGTMFCVAVLAHINSWFAWGSFLNAGFTLESPEEPLYQFNQLNQKPCTGA